MSGLQLGPWLDALNTRIRKHLKRDARNLQIGHAYLMPAGGIKTFADCARVLRDEIAPLLEEYFYEDFHMLQQVLGKDLVDAEQGCIVEELFLPGREEELLQAVRYEELQMIVIANGDVSLEAPADSDDEDSENPAEVE